jgi:hypothetical protein
MPVVPEYIEHPSTLMRFRPGLDFLVCFLNFQL